jgi:hypothetical protein
MSANLLKIIKPHVDAPCCVVIQAASVVSVFRCNCLHEVNSPWEANTSSTSQEIRRISCNAKVYYRVHKHPPLVCTLWTRYSTFTPFQLIFLRLFMYLCIYYFLWLCSPARAMTSSDCASQRGLWPPLSVSPARAMASSDCSPARAMASSSSRFPDHTRRRATVGRTPLDEWSVRRRDLYLTTHNTHNRKKNIYAASGFRTHDRSRRAAVDLRLRPRGHWDRRFL